ncbi:hypothetical protein OEA_29505 (plasmid) [Priestia megaterium NCT-2]|uniref:hypothetical protein n=1 Tax=Priestia TaxID=2800373 RepID=UPI0003483AC5|nr:hypothetical protein [Priestia megaterium]AYE53785.1 hypothetical protein OEA_29505 [Priestia megaterium NCT-2]
MNVEIGFLPKSYLSEVPEGGGFFPFGIDGEVPYIIEYEGQELDIEVFFNNWMGQLNKFPIYTLFAYAEIDEEEIDNTFSSANIEYAKLKMKKERFIKSKVQDNKQFEIVMSYLYSQGSMNDFAGWSLSEDLFSFDKRDMKTIFGRRKVHMPIITLQKDSTMFWVCYDGSSVISISNDTLFSTSDSIISSFPTGVKGIKFEYEE